MADVQEVVDRSLLTVLLGTTAEGKELWLKREPGQPLRHICFKGGGKLPECLEGGFSSIQLATQVVKDYVEAKANAGKKAKAGRSSK